MYNSYNFKNNVAIYSRIYWMKAAQNTASYWQITWGNSYGTICLLRIVLASMSISRSGCSHQALWMKWAGRSLIIIISKTIFLNIQIHDSNKLNLMLRKHFKMIHQQSLKNYSNHYVMSPRHFLNEIHQLAIILDGIMLSQIW